MNGNAEETPSHDAREVSQLELSQIYLKMWPCPPPSPLSLPTPTIVQRKQPETEVPTVPRNQAFLSVMPWRDSLGPCGHHSNMLTGRHGFVSPWIVPTPIKYEQMRYLSDNVQCSNGCSNVPLLLNIHSQTGAGGEPERLQKEWLFPKGQTTEETLSDRTHHQIWPQFIFCKGFWRQKLKKPQESEIREQ